MKSAFIVGYTGEVGKEVVKEAVGRNAFSSFVLIGRRRVEFKDDLAKLVSNGFIGGLLSKM